MNIWKIFLVVESKWSWKKQLKTNGEEKKKENDSRIDNVVNFVIRRIKKIENFLAFSVAW